MANNIAVSISVDTADLQVKRAIMSAELKAATKDLNDFAREAASSGSTETLRTSMLAAGDAVAKLKTQIGGVDSEFKRLTISTQSHTASLGRATVSAGQAQFAMRDLSYQISDVGTSLAGGINPMVVFAQQGNQIVGAISMMKAEATGFVGFLAGPWGAAIMAAVALIGVLISKHQDAAAKEDLHAKKALDLKGAIDQLNEATGAANKTAEQMVRDALKVAEALYTQELQTRRTTQAMLGLALQKYQTDLVQSSGPGQRGELGTLGADVSSNQVAGLQAALAKVNEELANAQKGFRGAQGFFTKQGIDDQFDAAAAATHRFDRAVSSLDARLRAGKVGTAQYAAEYRKLKQDLEVAEDAAKAHGKSSRGGGAKPKKDGGEADDLVQHLDAELTAKKLAWAKAQDAAGTAHEFSLAEEAAYWSKILQRTDLSAAQRAEIERKYLAAHGQITKERIAIVIEGYKQELAEAERNAAAKLEIANRALAYITKTFGAESREFAQAQAEIVRIKREAVQQQLELDEIRDKAIDKANLDQIAAAEEAAKHRVALGTETNAQLLTEQRAFENARFAIERAAAVRARAAVDPSKDAVKAKQLNLQIEQIERDHQGKMTALDRQASLERKRIAQQTFKPFADSLAQMVTLQKGFMSTINDMWKSFGSLVSQVITKWTENFLVALVTQEFAAERAHLKQVVHLAKQAAAGAYNAIVGIPIVGPILAPIAAATAFVGVMAFSAAGGYDVPRGGTGIDGRGGQIGIVHPEEMILPAGLANGVRSMFGGSGAASSNARFAANEGGGDTHHHYAVTINAADGQSVKRFFMDNKHHAAAAVGKAVRDGFRG